MSEENNNIVLENMLGSRNEFTEAFLAGVNYVTPLGSCSNNPVLVMPGRETEKTVGLVAGCTVGFMADAVLLYGMAEIAMKILDYL